MRLDTSFQMPVALHGGLWHSSRGRTMRTTYRSTATDTSIFTQRQSWNDSLLKVTGVMRACTCYRLHWTYPQYLEVSAGKCWFQFLLQLSSRYKACRLLQASHILNDFEHILRIHLRCIMFLLFFLANCTLLYRLAYRLFIFSILW